MPELIDLTGRQFDRWTVVRYGEKRNGNHLWWCRCHCGTEKLIYSGSLRRGLSRSCGCFWRDLMHDVNKGLRKSPTYHSWDNMIGRCYRPSQPDYARYGGRGIEVCERWRESFRNFLEDMGEKPPGTSVDRYPNKDGNYEPGNCRWATAEQQQNNKENNVRVLFQGNEYSLKELATLLNIPETTLRNRRFNNQPLAPGVTYA